MASDKIKGITIEIGGDTTKLGKAIADVEKKSRSLQGELKQINNLLKFDPKNTDLLSQKQAVLNDSINTTKEKLEALKNAETQVIAQFERGEVAEDQVRALQREIIKTEASLKSAEDELEDTNKALEQASKESESFGKAQKDTRSATEKLEDTISDQEEALKDLKDKYTNTVLEQGKYSKGAKELSKEIDSLSSELNDNKTRLANAKDAGDKFDRTLDDLEESARDAEGSFGIMTVALGNMVADGLERGARALEDFTKNSIDTGMSFESAMSEVQALSGATGEDLELLTETAKEYGATTVFSASESAQALKFMSLAGWSAKESSEALGGVLNLATASGMDLARASDIVTDYISAFGMEAKDASYMADLLAYAQANSNTSAEQLAEAYRNCGANLHASGQDIETVTSLLAKMADQGYKGSEAGTALSAIMRDLSAKMTNYSDATELANLEADGFTSITGDMADVLGRNAIAVGDILVPVSDLNGNFRDMTDILADVEKATNGLGDAERATALSATFTSDSTKGLNYLLQAGIDSASDFEEALRKSKDTAKEMGDVMNDNAEGDLKAMQSAIEDVQIALYEEMAPTIRDIIQIITDKVIPVIKNDVIPAIKEFIGGIIDNGDTILSVIAGIGAGFIAWNVATMISGVVSAIKAFQLANEGATIAQALLNSVMNANPMVMVASLIASLVAGLVAFIATNKEARDKVVEIWTIIKETIGDVIGGIVLFFQDAWSNIVEVWGVCTQFFQDTWDAIKNIFSTVGSFFSGVWNNIVKIFSPAITWFTNLFKSIQNTLMSIVNVIIGLLQGCWTSITTIFSVAYNWFNNTVLTPVKNAFSTTWTAISKLASECWTAIKNVFTPVVEWFNNTIITPVTNTFTGLWNTLKSGASGAWEGIKSVFSSVAEFFRSTFETAWTAVKNVFSTGGAIFVGITDGIVSAFKTVVNGIIGGINSVVKIPFDGINTALNKIRSVSIMGATPFGGLPTISVPQIPYLAKGGIVDKATLAMLGENGKEAIVPLENNTDWINKVAKQFHEYKAPDETKADSAILNKINDIYNKLDNLNQSIVLDTGVLVGQTINKIDERLAQNYLLRERGI